MRSAHVTRFLLIAALALLARPAAAQVNTADAAERGFQALQRGDADTAATMFRVALGARPRDPLLLFGAGVAAHLQGRERDASAALTEALHLEPRLTQASALLGEIAHAEGDIDRAIQTYEAALKHAPADMEMRSRLEMWRRESSVHSGLESLRDGRFSIMFQGRVEDTLAFRARSVLDTGFSTIGRALGAYPSSSINVILYTEKQFRDITGAPEWSGGGFDGQIRLPAQGAAENLALFDRMLVHELTHAMVHGLAPRNVPTWLHEGLAMYFEGHDVAEVVTRRVRTRSIIPLSQLQGSFMQLTGPQAAFAYVESAVAARVLVDRLGTQAIGMVLQAIDGGQTLDRALESHGLTMAELEAGVARGMGVKR